MSFQLLEVNQHVARKDHRCEWCGQKIEKTMPYTKYVGICEGYFQSTKMHDECHQAMQLDIKIFDDLDYFFEPFCNPRGAISN